MSVNKNNEAELSRIIKDMTASGEYMTDVAVVCGRKSDVAVVLDVKSFPSCETAVKIFRKLVSNLKKCRIYTAFGDGESLFKGKKSFVLLRYGTENGVCFGNALPGAAIFGFRVTGGDGGKNYAEKTLKKLGVDDFPDARAEDGKVFFRFYTLARAEEFAVRLAEAAASVDEESNGFSMITVEKFAEPFVTTAFSYELFRSFGLKKAEEGRLEPCYMSVDAREKCLLICADDGNAVDALIKYSEAING